MHGGCGAPHAETWSSSLALALPAVPAVLFSLVPEVRGDDDASDGGASTGDASCAWFVKPVCDRRLPAGTSIEIRSADEIYVYVPPAMTKERL